MNKQALLAVGIRILGIYTGVGLVIGIVRVLFMTVYSGVYTLNTFRSAYSLMQLRDSIELLGQSLIVFSFIKFADKISLFLMSHQKDSDVTSFHRVQLIEVVIMVMGINSLLSGVRYSLMTLYVYLSESFLSIPVAITALIFIMIFIVLLTKCTDLAKLLDKYVINKFVK